MRVTLRASEVHVWYAVTRLWTPRRHAEALVCLNEAERTRHERFRFPEDRRDFAAAHALLRRALSRYADYPPEAWRFATEPSGKPHLAVAPGPAARIRFNISHTRGLVACAIALDADVGVDVERIDRRCNHLAVADRYFAASEIAGLVSSGFEAQAARFVELWTLKESYLKAIGVGLSAPLTAFGFDIDADSGAIQLHAPDAADARGWEFALCAIDCDARLAVAVRGESGSPPRRITITHEDGFAGTPARLICE